MADFDHRKLDVYRVTIDFIAICDGIVENLPPGRSYLANQLRRACLSISLNVAEGAGEFSKKEKARFYRIALRSATECAAVLDVCRALSISDPQSIVRGDSLLHRIVPMLTKMIKNLSISGSGSGQGSGQGFTKRYKL